MKARNYTFLLLCFLSTGLLSAQPSPFIFPTSSLRGDVLRVFELQQDVYLRTGTWSFEKKDFIGENILEYDESGKLSQQIYCLLRKNRVFFRNSFSRGEGGQWTGETGSMRYVAAFDEEGNMSTMSLLAKGTKQINRKYLYQYHAGQHLGTRVEGPDPKVSYLEYTMEAGAIQTVLKYDSTGQLAFRSQYLHDDFGHPIEISTYLPDGQKYNHETYRYVYDAQGNWTKALKTDWRQDSRTLYTRTLVYRSTANSGYIPKSVLKGYWINPSQDLLLYFDGGEVTISEQKEIRRREKYSYNPYSGELLFSLQRNRNTAFSAYFDGTVLLLEGSDSGQVYTFKRMPVDAPLLRRFRHDVFVSREDRNLPIFREGGKSGLKDKEGKVVLAADYDGITSLQAGVFVVTREGSKRLVDAKGNALTSFGYDDFRKRSWGYISFTKGGKVGLMDWNGKERVPASYARVEVYNDRFAHVADADKRFGIYELDKGEIVPPSYRARLNGLAFNRQFSQQRKDREGDWLDHNFQRMALPTSYASIKPFDENRFFMRDSIGWGLLDSVAREVLPGRYKRVERGRARLAVVSDGDHLGLIDGDGKQLTPIMYDELYVVNGTNTRSGLRTNLRSNKSAALFVKDGWFGYLDGFGNEVFPLNTAPPVKRLYQDEIVPGVVKFSYPTHWKKWENAFTIQSLYERKDKGTLSYELASFTGVDVAWINLRHPKMEIQARLIGKNWVYSVVQSEANGTYNPTQRVEYCYIPISSEKMLSLTFTCDKNYYYQYAQAIINLLYSITPID